MSIQGLKQHVSMAPDTPGVYIFRDKRRKPLYIGKAVNIRARLSNYPRSTDTRIKAMIRDADLLDFQKTETDIEALILEARLIKQHRPKFNIVMRDDKQYGYVVFSDEDFPKIFITHQPENLHPNRYPLNAESIGPFTDIGALRTTLRILRKLFPYCTCKQRHHMRCLNAHIGRCLGICCLKTTDSEFKVESLKLEVEYKRNIRAIREILSGKRVVLIRQMEKEMRMLGKTGKLEAARELQKKIERIKRVFENARIIHETHNLQHETSSKHLEQLRQWLDLKNLPVRIEGYDVANISGQYATGSMIVFVDAQPDKNEYRKFNIRQNLLPEKLGGQVKTGDVQMLQQVLFRRFNHSEWPLPDLIIVDGGKAQLNTTIEVLSKFKVKSLKFKVIPVIALTKNDRHQGDHIYISSPTLSPKRYSLSELPPAVRNLILYIDSEAHRFAISHYRKLHRRSLK